MSTQNKSATAEMEIATTRIFNAPRERVWQMWTDPEHICKWWGANGFTNTIYEMDVRSGGVWRFIMHGPDGIDYPNLITYIEVVKPKLLRYQHGDEERPDHFQVTVRFTEQGNKTELYMQLLFRTVEERNVVVEKHGAAEGLNQTLNRLGELLVKI